MDRRERVAKAKGTGSSYPLAERFSVTSCGNWIRLRERYLIEHQVAVSKPAMRRTVRHTSELRLGIQEPGDNITLSAGLTSEGLIAPLRLIGSLEADIFEVRRPRVAVWRRGGDGRPQRPQAWAP
jgi:hypothetical protein